MVLQRESLDSGLSHPSRVLDLLDEYMGCVRHGSYTLDLVLNMVSSIICEMRGVSRRDDAISAYIEAVRASSGDCVSPDGHVTELEDLLDICHDESVSRFGLEPRMDIPDLADYRPGTDSICVVVDRDRDNRDKRAMYAFLSRCSESGYRPFISNPCFELWFLMHFEEFDRLDRDVLFNNPVEDGRRFTEAELDRILNGRWSDIHYSKESYDPFVFIHRTADAVDRGMGMCHDPTGLVSNLGTNLCDLLREICDRSMFIDVDGDGSQSGSDPMADHRGTS